MSQDILQREQEFRKINEALQYENTQIMKKFQDVMRKQDDFMICSISNKEIIASEHYNKTTSKNDKVHLKEGINVNNDMGQDDEVGIPDSVDEMGPKGMSRFYRAKIRTLQESYRKLDTEYRFKCDELKKLEKEVQRFSEKSEKWFQAYNGSKNNLSKIENQLDMLNSKLTCKQNENTGLKKEMEQIRKEQKTAALNLSGIEVRLNRALEENDKLKDSLKDAKEENKNLREDNRKETADLNSTIKRQERQKNELLTGFKKQSQLIYNLKKQKAYLEALKLADISEKEFIKILDWKIDD